MGSGEPVEFPTSVKVKEVMAMCDKQIEQMRCDRTSGREAIMPNRSVRAAQILYPDILHNKTGSCPILVIQGS